MQFARLVPKRRTVLIAVAALGATALLWGAGWAVVAAGFEREIDRWVAARRGEGWTASHGAIVVAGFPHRWRARIDAPALARPAADGPGFAWSGPWIELGWAPWSPSSVGIHASGTHRLDWGGAPFRIAAARIAGELRLGAEGGVVRVGVGGDDVTVTPPGGGPVRVNRAIVRAGAPPPGPPSDGPPPTLDADLEIFGLTLPPELRPALGRTVGHIALTATVLGAIPRGSPATSLTAWRDDGGIVEVTRLSLGWGALSVEGAGTVALDIGLQPVGAMTARIAGYGWAVERFAAAGLMTGAQGVMARLALGALARPPDGGGRPEISVPVSVQDGTLQVGPVALLRLPRIAWQ